MRDSVNYDATKDTQQDKGELVRNGLYAAKYEPCLFRNGGLDLPEQGWILSRKGEREVGHVIREIYDSYFKFFSFREEKNIAVCATEYYAEALRCYFEPVFGEFIKYCKATGQEGLYNRLEKIVSEGENFLLQGLREEIRENTARYALRPVSHYVRFAKLRLAHFREHRKKGEAACSAGQRRNEISYREVCETLFNDCTEKLECFSQKAQHRYEAYVDVLCLWLGNYQISLPDYADGEDWKVFCHALNRKRKTFYTNGKEGSRRSEKKYASYVPCGCGEKTCKTWETGDEADHEVARWYGTWHGEGGESFEFTEETIGGWRYNVRRCYMDVLPHGGCTHIEFCYEDAPHELWTMHIGRNLLELTGEGAKLYYIVLENMERQIMRAYCEDEKFFGKQEKRA